MKFLLVTLALLSLSRRQRRDLSRAFDGFEADDDLVTNPGMGEHPLPAASALRHAPCRDADARVLEGVT